MLSTAVDKSLAKIRLPELSDKKVYLDFSNLQSYDSEYVKSAFKACIAENGAVSLEKTEEADCKIEISCGTLGNEYKDTLLGIPALPVRSPTISYW